MAARTYGVLTEILTAVLN